MAFVLLSTLFFVVLGESIIVDAGHGVGKCKNISQVDTDFNFKEYATKNNGIWNTMLAPNTYFYRHMRKGWLETIPTEEDGVYFTNIFYTTDDGVIINLVENERLESLAEGHMTATIEDDKGNKEVFNFTVLKYVPGKYIYFYLCGDDGADYTDYRFLMTQGQMDAKIISKIKSYDEKLGFKNTLIPI